MWFEGKTTAKNFPSVFKDLMTTIPNGETEPLWKMVSSNVGTALTDDGYVFYSKGSSGTDKIYIGIKNAYETPSKWHEGQRLFITEGYTPNATPGLNGVFTGNFYNESIRFHHSSTFGGADPNLFEITYRISITKDRVIIIVVNTGIAVSFSTERVRCVTYLGLMSRYSTEPDSTASVIATTHGNINATYNNIRVLSGRNRTGGTYTPYNSDHFIVTNQHSGYGNKFHAVNIPLGKANEGLRGELDGMLAQRFITPASGFRSINEEGVVLINGKQYFTIFKEYYANSMHDNFAPSTYAMQYFIEMK